MKIYICYGQNRKQSTEFQLNFHVASLILQSNGSKRSLTMLPVCFKHGIHSNSSFHCQLFLITVYVNRKST